MNQHEDPYQAEVVMPAEALPPHDLAAEENVLGSIIIDPEAFAKARKHISAADFYRQQHAQVFAHCEKVYVAGGGIDQVTVTSELNRSLPDEKWGSILSHLVSVTATSVHVEYYAEMVDRTATSRRAIKYANEIVELAFTDPDKAVLTDQIFEAGLRVAGRKAEHRRLMPLSDVFKKHELDLIDIFTLSKSQRGISSGIKCFDIGTGGMQPGELGIIAARANMGKSFMANAIADNLSKSKRKDGFGDATDQTHNVAIFSLEMRQTQVYRRLVLAQLGVDYDHLPDWERDEMYGETYERMIEISERSIWLSEAPRLTVEDIRIQAMMLNNRKGIDVLIVDYMQLISPTNHRESKAEQLEHISRELKLLANELNCVVIALCQLNREVEKRGLVSKNFRPILSDLRGSGAIEQDADWVCFLYRHDFYVQRGMVDVDELQTDRLEFIFGKVREGAIETGLLAFFDPAKARLEDVSEDNDRPGA